VHKQQAINAKIPTPAAAKATTLFISALLTIELKKDGEFIITTLKFNQKKENEAKRNKIVFCSTVASMTVGETVGDSVG